MVAEGEGVTPPDPADVRDARVSLKGSDRLIHVAEIVVSDLLLRLDPVVDPLGAAVLQSLARYLSPRLCLVDHRGGRVRWRHDDGLGGPPPALDAVRMGVFQAALT